MLTPNDIYMIAGVMTMVSLPGSLQIAYVPVPDSASRFVQGAMTDRDGSRIEWAGVEGEASQPMTAGLVSEICGSYKQRSAAMPIIINAGLWPEAAARVGEDHGVRLMSLKPWNGKIYSDGVLVANEIGIKAVEYAWIGRPETNLYSHDDLLSGVPDHAPIDTTKVPVSNQAKTFGELKTYFADSAASQAEEQGSSLDIRAGDTKPQEFQGGVDFDVTVTHNGKRVPVTYAQIKGNLTKIVSDVSPQRMALFAAGSNKPWRGCEVIELNGEIATLIFDKGSRSLKPEFIPIREELVKAIFSK